MLWRICLVTAATLLALFFAVEVRTTVNIVDVASEWWGGYSQTGRVIAPFADTAESCYPFAWQKAERKRLREVLKRPETAPEGRDELALAQYARFVGQNGGEDAIREGIARDPNNALYHYYLADLYIQKGIQGNRGPTRDKATGKMVYDYKILDRALLDKGMKELTIGLKLPFKSRRDVLLRAQLAALPHDDTCTGVIRRTGVLNGVPFPEYSKTRNFARVNGFYLGLLLKEGKRAEAEPFLHTGEVLAVQLSNDTSSTLIGQLVAIAISVFCRKIDAEVCRAHGFEREAKEIEQRHSLLGGKASEWYCGGYKTGGATEEAMLREHGGRALQMWPALSYSPRESVPPGTITEEMLTPSRMVEYHLAERWGAMGLSLTCFMLVVLALIAQARRWSIARADGQRRAPNIGLSAGEWARVIGLGVLLPVALYLAYISIPGLAGRDQGLTSIHALIRFLLGIAAVGLWVLIVPAWLASAALLRRGIAAGVTPEGLRPGVVWGRLGFSAASPCWAVPAVIAVWAPIAGLLMSTVTASPFRDVTSGAIALGAAAIMLGIAVVPVTWEGKRPEEMPHLLAMGRTLLTVYAICALLIGGLAFVAREAERQCIRQDRIMGIANQSDQLSFTHIESRLVVALRDEIRVGAKQLGIRWE